MREFFLYLLIINLPKWPSLIYNPVHRGVAQPGSALVWGTSGRRFKSSRPDQLDSSG